MASFQTPIESPNQLKTLEPTPSPIQDSSDPPPMDPTKPDQENPQSLTSSEAQENQEEEEVDEDEEEEGECGFCLFMKGGGCKENFVSWEKCIEDAEKDNQDIVEKCFEITSALKKCMEAHSDYYEPVLRAEKAAEAEAREELEKEKAKEKEKEDEGVKENEKADEKA